MARSHVARDRGRLARAVAAWAVSLAAVTAAALPLLAAPARAASRSQAAAGPVTLSVTSVSPSYAEPGRTVTLSGTVRNVTGQAMTGLTVRMLTSRAPLGSVAALRAYTGGGYVALAAAPVTPVLVSRLGAHASARWHVRFPASALGLACFGVYPLTAQVIGPAGTQLAADPVPLPFWPSDPHACRASPRPKPAEISWIWPLIDTPHQGACPGLISNSLATSIAPGGRLYNLLALGARYASVDHLTWAIDPAVLDNVQTMTRPYPVGSAAECGGARPYPADPHAAGWRSRLVRATAGQPVFVTPYADVDIATLASRGNPDLKRALASGQSVARQVLGHDIVPAALPAGGDKLSAIAWPAGGIASPGMLEYLANLKVNTVILAMRQVPPLTQASSTPSAVTSVLDGLGGRLHVLRSDDAISQLLGSASARSRRPGAIAAVSQLFLAETAMIVAEQPGTPRPILVTPPRRWDPAVPLADALLAGTRSAPWLAPATIGQLVSAPPRHVHSSLPSLRWKSELSDREARKLAALDRRVTLLNSIAVQPNPRLRRAVFAVESSAWRGRAARHARAMLTRTAQYVAGQFGRLAVTGNQHVTLGGRISNVSVAIHNGLGYPVQLGLKITTSRASVQVTDSSPTHLVLSHKTIFVRLSVRAQQGGSAFVRLSLTSPEGTQLPGVARLTMQIRATDFGTVALMILAGALAVFVIASAVRAIRHGRPQPPAAQAAEPDGEPGAPQAPAEPQAVSSGYLPDAPEEADSVVPDRSELTPAGPANADTRISAPGRRPAEESR